MARLAELPDDMVFFTQITMEAAEDPGVPRRDAPRPHIKGALVGVEVGDRRRPEGRLQGLQPRRRRAGRIGCRRSASTASTCSGRSSSACRATARRRSTPPSPWRKRADLTFAQFVMLTPFPGTLDFEKWAEATRTNRAQQVDGIPVTQHWLIPRAQAAQALHAASDDVARGDPRRGRRAPGTSSTAAPNVWERARVRRVAASRAWRSC